MVKQDLIDRSPVRKFEKLLGGGVKAGEIGVIASKKGLGKTSILVQLAIDTLLQGKVVVHVSFNQQAAHVMTWYENIFSEQAKRKNLDKPAEVKAELMSRRIVLNFNQETVKTEQVIRTIRAPDSCEKSLSKNCRATIHGIKSPAERAPFCSSLCTVSREMFPSKQTCTTQ